MYMTEKNMINERKIMKFLLKENINERSHYII